MHELTISETNAGHMIAVCSCGWTGVTHLTPCSQRFKDGPIERRTDLSSAAARKEWTYHAHAHP